MRNHSNDGNMVLKILILQICIDLQTWKTLHLQEA